MTLQVKHSFVNPFPDDPVYAGTRPSDWNADHKLDVSSLSDTQILFVDGMDVAGDDRFKWNKSSGFLILGDADSGSSGNIITPGGNALNPTGRSFLMVAGSAFDDGIGGNANGGGFNQTAGDAANGGIGGDFSQTSGSADAGNGGSFTIDAGYSNSAKGGDVIITGGGADSGNAGGIFLNGGTPDTVGNGGSITIAPAPGSGGGVDGNLLITNLPIVNPGGSGRVWNNGGVLSIT